MADTAKVADKLVDVLISRLVIDPAWNARAARELKPDKLRMVRGVEGESLYESIAECGVRVPIDVVPEPGKGVERYRVVAGFRRATITQLLSEEEVKRDGPTAERYIPCLVRGNYTTETDRRRANLLESVGRQNLYPCEMCRGLQLYRDSFAKTPSVVDLALELGMQDRMVANYLRLRDKGSKELLDYWDHNPTVGVQKVLGVLTLPTAQQLPALKALLTPEQKISDEKVRVPKALAAAVRSKVERERRSKKKRPPAFWAGVEWLGQALRLDETILPPKA